jgi:hypothetical protein
MVAAPDQPRYIKRGGQRRFGASISFLPQPPRHCSPDQMRHKVRSEGRRLWCTTAPTVTFAKVVPGQCRWRPEGLRTFTRSRPSSTTMIDDLALGGGQKV